jgi:hypothetical protein
MKAVASTMLNREPDIKTPVPPCGGVMGSLDAMRTHVSVKIVDGIPYPPPKAIIGNPVFFRATVNIKRDHRAFQIVSGFLHRKPPACRNNFRLSFFLSHIASPPKFFTAMRGEFLQSIAKNSCLIIFLSDNRCTRPTVNRKTKKKSEKSKNFFACLPIAS